MTDSRSAASDWDRLSERLKLLKDAKPTEQASAANWAEKLARRAQSLRERMSDARQLQPQQDFLMFRSGSQKFAVALEHVLEVQPLDHFSPVPGSPDFIRGIVQCRGALLCLLDLDRLFGMPEKGLADVHHYVVVESHGNRVALAAGEAEEIIGVSASTIKATPAFSTDILASVAAGIMGDDRLILRIGDLLEHPRLRDWSSH